MAVSERLKRGAGGMAGRGLRAGFATAPQRKVVHSQGRTRAQLGLPPLRFRLVGI